MRGFRRLQNSLKPDQEVEIGGDYLRAAKEIARLLHERGDIEDAKNALSEAANKGSSHSASNWSHLTPAGHI